MSQALRGSKLSFVSCLVLSLCILGLLISPALAQVNGPGSSPANQFDVVLALPGDEAVITGASRERVGGVIEQTTQLNISEGGFVGRDFGATFGSEVNVSGGILGDSFEAFNGSEVNFSGGTANFGFQAHFGSVVNVSGGNVGAAFRAGTDSEVNISGGVLGRRFNARSGSDVELIGGEFRLNGADFTGGTISIANGDVFTGTLADGSSFIFSSYVDGFTSGDQLANVALTVVDLPPADTDPILLNAPSSSSSSGLRAAQALTVVAGGFLGDDFSVVDATLNVQAGTVGEGAEAANSLVNISGGTVGEDFEAYSGSEVNISGGTVGAEFDAFSGSEVNVSGGTVGSGFDAFSGSEVTISGGALGGAFEAFLGSDTELIGGEFRLNGVDYTDGTVSLVNDEYIILDGDVLTGTLADGSTFIFSPASDDRLENVTLTLVDLPPVDASAKILDTPMVNGPAGLRAGQTLTVVAGGSVGSNFSFVNATLDVAGGTVGDGAEAYDSLVEISGGSVGDNFSALSGSVVNISGGSVGQGFDALFGSEVNISGGTVGNNFVAYPGSVVNIRGYAFSIDGLPLSNVQPGQPVTITERSVTLSGMLADGAPFSFELNFRPPADEDAFFQDATLTVTLDAPFRLGDINQDGVVSFSDIPEFITVLASGEDQAEADCNQDGVVNFVDIPSFIVLLAN